MIKNLFKITENKVISNITISYGFHFGQFKAKIKNELKNNVLENMKYYYKIYSRISKIYFIYSKVNIDIIFVFMKRTFSLVIYYKAKT